MEDLQLLQENSIEPIKTLGQGAYGRVYLAFHYELGVIAAKVLLIEKFDEKEWDAAGALNKPEYQCPFVVNYLFARKFENNVVILMSYANAKSLDVIVKNKNLILPIPSFRALAKQLIEGLRIIHSANLIHRDIKAENIMLHSQRGNIKAKIADFGLAKIKQDFQLQITSCGTPLNMAPELVNHSFYSDNKVDIYSLGVVFFQLLIRDYPINAGSIKELGNKMIQMKRISRPSAIKDDLLWDLLSKMLNFDPKQRYSAEQALQHPFFTSQQANSQISQYALQIAQSAKNAQQRGETWVTIYDTNPTFIVPSPEIKVFLNFDPEAEELKIVNQRKPQPIYQNNNQIQVLNPQQNNPQQQNLQIDYNNNNQQYQQPPLANTNLIQTYPITQNQPQNQLQLQHQQQQQFNIVPVQPQIPQIQIHPPQIQNIINSHLNQTYPVSNNQIVIPSTNIIIPSPNIILPPKPNPVQIVKFSPPNATKPAFGPHSAFEIEKIKKEKEKNQRENQQQQNNNRNNNLIPEQLMIVGKTIKQEEQQLHQQQQQQLQQDVDMELIECDICNQKVRFHEYNQHQDNHTIQQELEKQNIKQPKNQPKYSAASPKIFQTTDKQNNSINLNNNQLLNNNFSNNKQNQQQNKNNIKNQPLIQQGKSNQNIKIIENTTKLQQEDVDMELIECDICNQKVRFHEYNQHQDNHTKQQGKVNKNNINIKNYQTQSYVGQSIKQIASQTQNYNQNSINNQNINKNINFSMNKHTTENSNIKEDKRIKNKFEEKTINQEQLRIQEINKKKQEEEDLRIAQLLQYEEDQHLQQENEQQKQIEMLCPYCNNSTMFNVQLIINHVQNRHNKKYEQFTQLNYSNEKIIEILYNLVNKQQQNNKNNILEIKNEKDQPKPQLNVNNIKERENNSTNQINVMNINEQQQFIQQQFPQVVPPTNQPGYYPTPKIPSLIPSNIQPAQNIQYPQLIQQQIQQQQQIQNQNQNYTIPGKDVITNNNEQQSQIQTESQSPQKKPQIQQYEQQQKQQQQDNIESKPQIPCEICNNQIPFSQYEEHVQQCQQEQERKRIEEKDKLFAIQFQQQSNKPQQQYNIKPQQQQQQIELIDRERIKLAERERVEKEKQIKAEMERQEKIKWDKQQKDKEKRQREFEEQERFAKQLQEEEKEKQRQRIIEQQKQQEQLKQKQIELEQQKQIQKDKLKNEEQEQRKKDEEEIARKQIEQRQKEQEQQRIQNEQQLKKERDDEYQQKQQWPYHFQLGEMQIRQEKQRMNQKQINNESISKNLKERENSSQDSIQQELIQQQQSYDLNSFQQEPILQLQNNRLDFLLNNQSINKEDKLKQSQQHLQEEQKGDNVRLRQELNESGPMNQKMEEFNLQQQNINNEQQLKQESKTPSIQYLNTITTPSSKTGFFSKVLSIFQPKQTQLQIIIKLEKEKQKLKNQLKLYQIENYENFSEQTLLIFKSIENKHADNISIMLKCPLCDKHKFAEGIELHIQKKHKNYLDGFRMMMQLHQINKQIDQQKIIQQQKDQQQIQQQQKESLKQLDQSSFNRQQSSVLQQSQNNIISPIQKQNKLQTNFTLSSPNNNYISSPKQKQIRSQSQQRPSHNNQYNPQQTRIVHQSSSQSSSRNNINSSKQATNPQFYPQSQISPQFPPVKQSKPKK